jgi:peptidoglycan/LPS O-acetylase OafA/YrhL
MLVADLLIGPRTYDAILADPHHAALSTLSALPYFLTFTQSWIYHLVDGRNLIYQIGNNLPLTWSISTEWFFYISYPAILLFVIRAKKATYIIGLAITWTVIWAAFASELAAHADYLDSWAAYHFGSDASVRSSTEENFVRWLLYFSPYLRIGEFVIGCIAAQLFMAVQGKKVGPRERNIAMVCVIVGIVSLPVLTYMMYAPDTDYWVRRLNNNYGLAPSVAVLLFCASRYDFSFLKWLSWRPMLRLGEASYSIYLTHFFILWLICGSQGPLIGSWQTTAFLSLRLVAALGLVLLVSISLYAWVEDPARRLLRSFWRRPSFPTLPASIAAAPLVAGAAAFILPNVLVAAASVPPLSGIVVQSATYGGNCGAPPGNATAKIQGTCDGRSDCSYVVDVEKLGDPARGCGKNFVVNFVCAPQGKLSRVELPGEAGLKSIAHLTCNTVTADAAANTVTSVAADTVTSVTAGFSRVGLSIASATYGANCGAATGNATKSVAESCNGKAECSYTVDVKHLGDPARDCGKDFGVNYYCPSEVSMRHVQLPGEAGLGSVAKLTCSSTESEEKSPKRN